MSVGTLLAGAQAPPRRLTRGKVVALVLAIAALPGGFALILLGRWPMLKVVETGKTPEYPYLQPAPYAELPQVVFDAAKARIGGMSGWTISASDRDEGIITARVTTRPFGFQADVTIRMRRADGVTLVSVRSETVSANKDWADFGQNARNVRRFLKELRGKMASQGSEPHRPAEGGASPAPR